MNVWEFFCSWWSRVALWNDSFPSADEHVNQVSVIQLAIILGEIHKRKSFLFNSFYFITILWSSNQKVSPVRSRNKTPKSLIYAWRSHESFVERIQVALIDEILQLMLSHQRDGHSKRRPQRVAHLVLNVLNVDTSTLLGRGLVVQSHQQMLAGFFVRLQVYANHADVVASSNESRFDL